MKNWDKILADFDDDARQLMNQIVGEFEWMNF